jgi:hypothetical protein
MNRFSGAALLLLLSFVSLQAQNSGNFSGSLESTTHYYLKDDLLGITKPENPIASNNYLHLQYHNGPFSAAMQYEAYMPPLSGYPYQLEGNGITHLSFRYAKDIIDITAGSFYEQFGNGLIFRSYESRELGINNAVNGVRLILKPAKFLRITGLYGKPRKFLEISSSYLRGIDTDLDLGDLMKSSLGLKLGAGLLSKYEVYTGPEDDFPSTVNAYSMRLSANYSQLDISSEYVYKSPDPSVVNPNSTVNGGALLINTSYSAGGIGIFASVRFLEEMDFRSERESEGNYYMINYLPSNTWQHTFLLGSIYPYSTQQQGEASIQTDINYTPEKGNLLGGKYGTKYRLGFSHVRNLALNGNSSQVLLSFGNEIYYQDLTFEINRKWSPGFKTITSVTSLRYDKSVIENPGADFVKAFILNFETQVRFSDRLSLRTELQHLWTKQDDGNWIAGLAEFGWAPHLSLFVSDMYDYLNSGDKVHYYNTGLSFSADYMRISAGYGRQREGQICAGGVCQRVPAYKGLNLKITVNF